MTTHYKKIIKYATIIFIILVVAIFIAILLFYGTLKGNILSLISTYGYFMLFIMIYFLELLFQPIAADLPIFATILAGANVYWIMAAVLLGSYAASITNYIFGRLYGKIGLKEIITEKKYEKWKKYYDKYGKAVLFIAAVTPVPYAPLCWMVGMFKMKKRDFIVYGLLPRTIRYLIDAYLAVLIFML